jgi:hypothetical protein
MNRDAWSMDQRLQRLVDGELNGQERAALMAELDERDDAWRELALAFVEDAVWRRGYEALAEQALPLVRPRPATDKNGAAGDGKLASSIRRGGIRGLAVPWLGVAIAASVLIAAGTLWWAVIHRGSSLAGYPGAIPPAASTASLVASPQRLQLVNTYDESTVAEVPLYGDLGPVVDSFGPETQIIDPDLRRSLLRSGYVLQPQWRVASGTLPDGRTVLVPVSGVTIRAIGQ